MKLDIFNPWRKLGGLAGKTLEYQTSALKSGFATSIREAQTKQLITRGYGVDKEKSQQAAYANLKRIGVEGMMRALETKQPVMPTEIDPREERKDIDWRDGVGHSYKAQKRIVGETLDLQLDEALESGFKLLIEADMEHCKSNPVAKNMNKFNKPATHKDKKNDYKRKPKNEKEDDRKSE